MGKGFKHGSGVITSGSEHISELNFSVNAYASDSELPSEENENAIAVITNAEMTSWTFSATEPEAPIDGTVWFITGKSSNSAFNALASNELTVYPLGARQYINGSWEKVPAKIFQEGSWVDWAVYLFSYGETFDSVSGGWSNVSGDHLVANYNGAMSQSGTTSALKEYSTLHFTYKITNAHGSGNGNVQLVIKSPSNTELASWSTPTNGLTSTEVCMDSLDISSITSECYITFAGWYGTAEFYELWLD